MLFQYSAQCLFDCCAGFSFLEAYFTITYNSQNFYQVHIYVCVLHLYTSVHFNRRNTFNIRIIGNIFEFSNFCWVCELYSFSIFENTTLQELLEI